MNSVQTMREAKVVVISDVHLGSYGAHAKELAKYLKAIEPEILILNGDIIDGWAFSKRYRPNAHTKVLQRILRLAGKGTTVYYITGNHDEMLRRFSDVQFGNFHLCNKLLLKLDGKIYWFFHGDIFDITMKNSKWLAKLGGKGYDLLILMNSLVNTTLSFFGRERISFSNKVKNGVKLAVKYISDFEKTATDLAIENKYDYVVCGHVHQPIIRPVSSPKGTVTYMNSGDWIENLTSWEYENARLPNGQGEWKIFNYQQEMAKEIYSEPDEPETKYSIGLHENIIWNTMYR